jgi:cytochrome c oxidase subunit III
MSQPKDFDQPTVDYHHGHHFENIEHEFDSAKQGTWLFLLQEVLFFSALFVAYIIYRALYSDMFVEASQFLDWRMGALNTVVLITSSLTMAMAVTAAQKGQKKKLIWMLVLTLLFAFCFLVVKYFEYSHKIHLGLYPHAGFPAEMFSEPNARIFFSIYFVMTGIHGIHVVGGMVVIGWLIKRAMKGEFGSNYYTPVEMVGLYWHFVDLIWIYLFPLLYLI